MNDDMTRLRTETCLKRLLFTQFFFRLRIFGRSTGRENSDIVGECAR